MMLNIILRKLPSPHGEFSVMPSSVVIQRGLGRTWSEIPKTGFLTTWLIQPWHPICWQTVELLIPTIKQNQFYFFS